MYMPYRIAKIVALAWFLMAFVTLALGRDIDLAILYALFAIFTQLMALEEVQKNA